MSQLTPNKVRNAKPRNKDYMLADRDGLYLRIRTSGSKSWLVRQTRQGQARTITLGKVTNLGLNQARALAAKYTGRSSWQVMTLRELLDEWYREHIAPNHKRPEQTLRYIGYIGKEMIADMRLADIRRAEISEFIRRYGKQHGPVAANRLQQRLNQAFIYAVEEGYMEQSPIAGMKRKFKEKACQRVLTDDEIRALWHSQSSHTALLRFLLLTGQRIGEAQMAAWSNIEDDIWHIVDNKSNRPHWVALSIQARELLDAMPTDREQIFGSFTLTGVQSWVRRWCERHGMDKKEDRFTPHDLRRTVATRMNQLGVQVQVVEKILNHSMSGVLGIYNQYDYADERIEAMERWADALTSVVDV